MTTSSSASDLDWSETRKWVGRNLISQPREGADPVERSTIRRQTEVLEMDCPLHLDDAMAKRHGYKGIVAPAHMLTIFNWGALWKPGAPTRWPSSEDVHYTIQPLPQGEDLRVPGPGTSGFVTDLECEYLEPLYVGDTVIQTENKLLEVNPRKTRVGDGAFLTYQATYTNQRGEIIARTKTTIYSYVPAPRQG